MGSSDQPAALRVGVDVGSTTVKVAVVDADDAVQWKAYRRHNAKQPELVREYLLEVEQRFPGAPLQLFVTGSGGRAIAPHVGARYIQEVNAVTHAVERLHPGAGSVIELGGQDAKVIIWTGDEQRGRSTLTFMNDKCAGGTGATIDKILGKLGMTVEEAAALEPAGRRLHRISAKCGVFAETDVVGLLKAGIDERDIFYSLATAIAKQNIEVLVRGNVLADPVLLLGGPNRFLPLLTHVWRELIPETWQTHGFTPAEPGPTRAIAVPPDAEYFAALGAVYFASEADSFLDSPRQEEQARDRRYRGVAPLEEYISRGRVAQLSGSGAVKPGLVQSEDELARFIAEYPPSEPKPPAIPTGAALAGYLGVDGGSTSSKLVLVDRDGALLYRDYVLSSGNPVVDVREMFGKLAGLLDERGATLEVLGAAVTGYASEIIHKAFRLDLAIVETVAHLRSATTYHGEVDIICDVGGQDIKVLFLRGGRVIDFRLNTQCSAGNGYFLQSMADQFAIPVHEYAEHAFRARQAPAFNYGCAVFMEQDKVNFQQLGWSKEEIMAGLALVLPLNIWNYVVQETNIARFGKRVLLQGGTQRNLAAVKAQVDFIKQKIPGAVVQVHEHADICGAIGAALEARDTLGDRPSGFVGLEAASRVSFTSTNDETTRCRLCHNECPRAFIDISVTGGETVRHISGAGCERGSVEDEERAEIKARKKRLRREVPNLAREAGQAAFGEFRVPELPRHGDEVPVPEWGGVSLVKAEPRPCAIRFERSDEGAARRRAEMVVGIPRLLNLFLYAPFFSTYFRALGVGGIAWSEYTSERLWARGNRLGAIDPCFPAKVAPAHMISLLERDELTHICFPIITHLESVVGNNLGNNACVIQMGTPEVVHAVLTKHRDFFADSGVEYWKPLVRMDRPREAAGELFAYFGERLGVTAHESGLAAAAGFAAQADHLAALRDKGRRLIDELVESDRIGILVIDHPYHHDPGLNHGILDELRLRGFPLLAIESLPVDDEFLGPLFGAGSADDDTAAGHDIKDVWQRNFNRNTNHKIWAAKVAARHPNLAVLDLSSFKCGHDAPTYSYIDNILDAADTPHFLFHDIDQNRPRATFKIRIQTIDYFLRLEEARLRERIAAGGTA